MASAYMGGLGTLSCVELRVTLVEGMVEWAQVRRLEDEEGSHEGHLEVVHSRQAVRLEPINRQAHRPAARTQKRLVGAAWP